MERFISDFFKKEDIKYFSSMNVGDCKLLYPAKLPEYTRSVCFFLIPYYAKDEGERNISLYAVSRDYHLYIKELSERFESLRTKAGLSFEYRFFADNSPFCERTCVQACGLGQRGKNGLVINPEYGSFVFIGSICLSLPISISQTAENFKSDLCGNCEKCKTFCPVTRGRCSECLSAITQKKKIDAVQEDIIRESSVKWGCDICQLVCPYNRDISETPIAFFRTERTPYLCADAIDAMSEEEFRERAYSWRGREVIKRNLGL